MRLLCELAPAVTPPRSFGPSFPLFPATIVLTSVSAGVLRNLFDRKRVHDQRDDRRKFASWLFVRRIISKFQRAILEGTERHLAVVERDGVVGKLLVGLVPFPGDEDEVARLRQRKNR